MRASVTKICLKFPFGYIFGRLGCFTAHDHIGVASTSFIAVDYPVRGTAECEALSNSYFCVGPRLDMALIEAMWLAVICLVFFLLRKRTMPRGSFLAIWCMMYSPVRLVLDNFRNQDLEGADVRYLGLTPAQYWALTTFSLGLALLFYFKRRDQQAGSDEEVIVIDASRGAEGEEGDVESSEGEEDAQAEPT